MKLSLTVFFLITGVLAATSVRREPDSVKRDLATITQVVNGISTKVDTLDSAALSFTGDGTELQAASNDVLSTIKAGTTTIQATSDISTTDALTLQSVIQDLTTKINTTVNDVIAKKSALVSAGLGDTVHQSFVDQQSASQALATTITSKVPEALQPIAQQLSAGISSALQSGIDAFAGTGSATSSISSVSVPSVPIPTPPSTPVSSIPSSGTPAPNASSTPSTTSSSAGISAISPSSGASGVSGASGALPSASSTLLPFTGAAAPTMHAGFGTGLVAALVAVAAL